MNVCPYVFFANFEKIIERLESAGVQYVGSRVFRICAIMYEACNILHLKNDCQTHRNDYLQRLLNLKKQPQKTRYRSKSDRSAVVLSVKSSIRQYSKNLIHFNLSLAKLEKEANKQIARLPEIDTSDFVNFDLKSDNKQWRQKQKIFAKVLRSRNRKIQFRRSGSPKVSKR